MDLFDGLTSITSHPTLSAHSCVIRRTSLSRARSGAICTVEPTSGIRMTVKKAPIMRIALRRLTARFSAVRAGVAIWYTRNSHITTMPVPRIDATLVPNRNSAPAASSHAPDSAVSPTTESGGTSEMAMATPGNVSEMSRRTSATEPTAPVASAATRSISFGLTLPATWALVAATTGFEIPMPSRYPMRTAAAAPVTTRPMERNRLARSPSTTASIVPRMGVISGATIMAPMTVAVESPTTPAAAMIDARISRIQNRDNFRRNSAPSKKTSPRM